MQPHFQANILLINLISNNYTIKLMVNYMLLANLVKCQLVMKNYPGITIYTLGDLGDSSNLTGSLSRTMTLYSPQYAVNVKQNKIAVVYWVFCQSFMVRTFWKYKNIQGFMTLKVRKDLVVFKQRDLLWSVWCMRLLCHCFCDFRIFSQDQFCL